MKKWTKKQLAALRRIVDREQARYDHEAQQLSKSEEHKIFTPKQAGVHPSGLRFAVTDGSAVVMLSECPEELPTAERMDLCEEVLQRFVDGDSRLVVEPPSADQCKEVIRAWRQMHNLGKPQVPGIRVSVTDESSGVKLESSFDARKYLDVVEAMGPNCAVYLGRGEDRFGSPSLSPYPSLLVYRRDGRGTDAPLIYDEPALLLPCRPDR